MPVANHANALIAAIDDDHQKMYKYYDQYNKSTGDVDAQGRWARQFIWEVARHIVGEEHVVYPLMEQYLKVPGRMFADEDREVHQKVKTLLHDVESHKAGSPRQVEIFKSVMEYLRPHNDYEVQRDLPLLTKAMGEEASVHAAARFRRKEKFAPTHTHPTVTGFFELPIDKIKDLFVKFPTHSELSALETTNHALIDAIADDHREIRSYYDQYIGSDGDVEAQTIWARQLIWDIARHVVGVELVVHPLMRQHLLVPGQLLAHESHEVHQEIRVLLYDIDSHKPESQECIAILMSVMELLGPHNDTEVKRDLPLLVEAMRANEAAQAAASFERTKQFAPTRAHPNAHDNLPFETSAALLKAPINQLEDFFANFQ